MRDEAITALDPVVDEVEKMAQLCATVGEAAGHAAAHPGSAPEMRALIREAVEQLGEKAGGLFPPEDALRGLTRTHLDVLESAPAAELPAAARAWRSDFLTQVVQGFFRHLQDSLQVSAQTSERIEALIDGPLSLTPRSRSRMLLETGLRCGITAPERSARMMIRALTLTPDLLKDQAEHLKGFVFQPERHPQAEFTRCPVCGGEGAPYRAACSCYVDSYDPMFLPAKLWMRCPGCGVLYTRWFPREFLSLGREPRLVEPRAGRIAVSGASSTLLRSWSEILRAIREISPQGGSDLLEVGVGSGHLIAVAQEMGYRVTAVEIMESTAQETADLLECPILCGDFLRMPEDRCFDIITMGNVLEHLQAPAEGVRKAFRLLRRGGVLWLSTPNCESAFSRLTKTRDPMWREPYHISYFSRTTLTRLVEETGFQVLDYAVSGHYNGSMELLLRRP